MRSAFICAAVTVLVTAAAAFAATPGVQEVRLGLSVDGRPLVAFEVGDIHSRRKVLVVGCIHGDETAGVAIARRLERASPQGVDLWVLPMLNPDGCTANTRGNARGVDLNRNFPWRWRQLGGTFYSGTRPLSEPESRVAYRLIERLRPHVSIWFHQRLDAVDVSGGDPAIEQRFAALAGLPLARLAREPGSVVGWENHTFPGTTAFVVELPAHALTASAVRRYAGAVLAVASPSP